MKAFVQIRPARLLILLVAALLAGLATDWFRSERVVFSPPITTEPVK